MNHRRPLEPCICLELERDLGRFSHPGNLEQVQLFLCKHQTLLWLHPSLPDANQPWHGEGNRRARAEPRAAPDPRTEQGTVRMGQPHAPTLHKDMEQAIPLPRCSGSCTAAIAAVSTILT